MSATDREEAGAVGHHRERAHARLRRHHEPGPPWTRHMRGGWYGPPWGPPGRRARRGDVRAALLALLDEHPLHGYDVIRELEERSGGLWHPSPGSIYPTLQMLEEGGLLTSQEVDGKRVYSITEAGKAELAERRERSGGTAPWELAGKGWGEGLMRLRGAMAQLGAAAMQVGRTGDAEQVSRAADVLTEARKKVYAILAED